MIENRFGDALLALIHDRVDKLGHNLVAVLGIRQNLAFSYFTFARHSALLGSLRPVFGASLASLLYPDRIQSPTHDMIAHARQIFDATAANQNHRVLLQVMTDPRDIGGHLDAIGQAHTGDFAQRRIGLLRCRCINARANAALLRTALQSRRRVLRSLFFSAFAHQLTDRRHMNSLAMDKWILGSLTPDKLP